MFDHIHVDDNIGDDISILRTQRPGKHYTASFDELRFLTHVTAARWFCGGPNLTVVRLLQSARIETLCIIVDDIQ